MSIKLLNYRPFDRLETNPLKQLDYRTVAYSFKFILAHKDCTDALCVLYFPAKDFSFRFAERHNVKRHRLLSFF